MPPVGSQHDKPLAPRRMARLRLEAVRLRLPGGTHMRITRWLRPRRVLAAMFAVGAGALACSDTTTAKQISTADITGPSLTLGVGFNSSVVGRGNLGTFNIRSNGDGDDSEGESHDNADAARYDVQLKSHDNTDVVVANIVVVPSGSSGWHMHPGPALVVVKSGAVTTYHAHDRTCSPTRHPAGTSFIEEGEMVHIARNEGTVDATLVTTYFVPAGSPTRIDAAAPGNCPF